LLVEAGLSNFEALATGTRNAAQVTGRMGAADDWGTITAGNRADLILLTNNPLEDVVHTQERLGVMVRGQWFTQTELDGLVNELVASYDTQDQEEFAIITVPHGDHVHTITVRRSGWQRMASSLALNPGYTRHQAEGDTFPLVLIVSFLPTLLGWGIVMQIWRRRQ
jgi:adenine deaminase